MPRSQNIDIPDQSAHIGIRINKDKKAEYIKYLNTLINSEGKLRFRNLSQFVKYLIDGYIDGTIIEAKTKKQMEHSESRTREIIKEEMKEATITFKNMITDFKSSLSLPEISKDYDMEHQILMLLEANNLTSERMAEILKVKEPVILKSLNRLVDVKMVKLNKNSEYEVMY